MSVFLSQSKFQYLLPAYNSKLVYIQGVHNTIIFPHKSKPTKGKENEISSLVPNQNSDQEVSRNIDCRNTEPSTEFVHEVPLGTIVKDASLGLTVDSQESGINVASAKTYVGLDVESQKRRVDPLEVDYVL
jgi:hypothetical protein